MSWVGLIISAVGGIQKGQAEKQQAELNKINLNMQADLADQSARISEIGYKSYLQKGEMAKQSSQLQTASLKSTQKARMAASGVALSGDSQQNILNTTDLFGEIDANTIESNAIQQAWGYKAQGQNYKTQAKLGRFSADTINPSQVMSTSLLGSATQIASSSAGQNQIAKWAS